MRSPIQQEAPPENAGMQLSSEDMTDLTDMLKKRGLLAVAAAQKASREIAKLANPALIARLANSVHFLEEAVKHLARTYDGLPQGDPLSTSHLLHHHDGDHPQGAETTSEARAISYIDDTALVGPADEPNSPRAF